jgi:hypothetical protein
VVTWLRSVVHSAVPEKENTDSPPPPTPQEGVGDSGEASSLSIKVINFPALPDPASLLSLLLF